MISLSSKDPSRRIRSWEHSWEYVGYVGSPKALQGAVSVCFGVHSFAYGMSCHIEPPGVACLKSFSPSKLLIAPRGEEHLSYWQRYAAREPKQVMAGEVYLLRDIRYSSREKSSHSLRKSSRDLHPCFVAHFQGVISREQAQSLQGKPVFCLKNELIDMRIPEDHNPQASNQPPVYVYSDLYGKPVLSKEEEVMGEVVDIQNFGASNILIVDCEVPRDSEEPVFLQVPYVKEYFEPLKPQMTILKSVKTAYDLKEMME